jgi:predicted PurR-regulated permease PerM
LAILTAGAIINSVLPQILDESRQLAERIPSYGLRLQQRIRYWSTHPPAHLRRLLNLTGWTDVSTNQPAPVTPTPDLGETNAPANSSTPNSPSATWSGVLDPKTVQSITVWLAGALSKVGSWLLGQVTRVASFFGVLAGLILIPVYAFYLLLEKRGIARNWTDYLPLANSGAKDEMIFVLSSINECLIAFFRGQVLVAICDGILYTAGFLSIGLPYAFLLGALAIFLTMIPFLGAIVTCIMALIIASVQFGDWLHPLLVLAVFGVVQMLEGLVISPKIMGGRVGLHPLTIIIAVMVGTSLMGNILGGILAIPLTAALRALMVRYVWKIRRTPV